MKPLLLLVLPGIFGFFLGILLGTAIIGCIPPVHAAEIDLMLYREQAIQPQESGGEADCTIAHGKAGEIGCHQIKLGTARQAGFTGPAWMLWIPDLNTAWASEILRRCAARRFRHPVRSIAQCYNRGIMAPVGPSAPGYAYALSVEARYMTALAERAKRQLVRN